METQCPRVDNIVLSAALSESKENNKTVRRGRLLAQKLNLVAEIVCLSELTSSRRKVKCKLFYQQATKLKKEK